MLPLALAGDAGKNHHDAQPQVSKKQEKCWRALWDREAEGASSQAHAPALWISNWGPEMGAERSWNLKDEILPWGATCWTDVEGQPRQPASPSQLIFISLVPTLC